MNKQQTKTAQRLGFINSHRRRMGASRNYTSCSRRTSTRQDRLAHLPVGKAGRFGSINSAGDPLIHPINCCMGEEESGRNMRTWSSCDPGTVGMWTDPYPLRKRFSERSVRKPGRSGLGGRGRRMAAGQEQEQGDGVVWHRDSTVGAPTLRRGG
jgi:hypothetical protein